MVHAMKFTIEITEEAIEDLGYLEKSVPRPLKVQKTNFDRILAIR
jgi:hypothetical protein